MSEGRQTQEDALSVEDLDQRWHEFYRNWSYTKARLGYIQTLLRQEGKGRHPQIILEGDTLRETRLVLAELTDSLTACFSIRKRQERREV